MEKNFKVNLTSSESYNIECALHHIIACYVNRSRICNGLVNGTEYRHLESVLLSEHEFNVLTKLHDLFYSHLYGDE